LNTAGDSLALVQIEDHEGVRCLGIANPPVNALAHPVRVALLRAIEQADNDSRIRAIVVHGNGAHFVAGAEIREFDADPRSPILAEVLNRFDRVGKPLVAAIHGSALGGGMEVALACHHRVAHAKSQFGLPEVKLGLLPGAGGTVRLPRLIGVDAALQLMVGGDSIDCARAAALGLVDRVIDGGADSDAVLAAVRAAGVALARELLQANAAPTPLRMRPLDSSGLPADYFTTQTAAADKAARGHGSQPDIVRCMEAAVREPFDAALAFARARFEERRIGTPSRALRHLFFAERGARGSTGARAVREVGVIGSGTMGSGIAVSLVLAGYTVTMIDTNEVALAQGAARVRETIAGNVSKGRIAAAQGVEASARLRTSADYAALAQAELVIEAVFENMAVKQEVFGRLDAVCKAGAVLASNTSTLDVDAIAHSTQRPADVLGMHFFSPANIMKLVEVVRGRDTSDAALSTVLAATRRMGKLGVVVGNCTGFVGNRMLYAYGRENQSMLLEGARPQQIDAALKKFGMAMGPHAVGDLAGLDIGYKARRERKDLPDDPRYYRVADLLVEAGRLGQKSGRGMYLYQPGNRDPQPDPQVDALIATESARQGIARRSFTDEEIVERGMLALINEGARILEEGIASSGADIDAIWCNGYGYPRWRGGPMFYADTLGLTAVVERTRAIAAQPGLGYWQVAPLLQRLAEDGASLARWTR
jgi:3-hydroxyacyl-CoA dehydrogenase